MIKLLLLISLVRVSCGSDNDRIEYTPPVNPNAPSPPNGPTFQMYIPNYKEPFQCSYLNGNQNHVYCINSGHSCVMQNWNWSCYPKVY
jgi:hypothetical protein